jgi:cytochrome c oxidase assembly protein subunit 15
LDAGLIYNTFPMMADRWIPSDMWALSPTWMNFLDNPTTVQFEHRYLAIATLCGITALFVKSRKLNLPPRVRFAINALTLMVYIQAGLGIATLLYVVPVPLASAHQVGATGMLSASAYLLHAIRSLPK